MSNIEPTPPEFGDQTSPMAPLSASNGDLVPPATPAYAQGTPVPPANTTNTNGGRNRLPIVALSIALVVLLLAVVVGVALSRKNNNVGATPPSASSILTSAKQASLKDAAFALDGTIAINLAGTTATTTSKVTPTPDLTSGATTITLSGTGKFTASPARTQLSVNIPLIGPQNNIDVITDGNDLYLRGLNSLFGGLGGTTSTTDSKWTKTSTSQTGTSTSAIQFSQVYDSIKNPTVVGSESINGQDSWHITGTVNTAAASGTPGVSATATAISSTLGIGANTKTTEDIWITKDKYLLAKVALHVDSSLSIPGSVTGGLFPTGGSTTPTPATAATPAATSTGITVNLNVIFSKWNTGNTITVPSPDQIDTSPSGIPGLPVPTPTA